MDYRPGEVRGHLKTKSNMYCYQVTSLVTVASHVTSVYPYPYGRESGRKPMKTVDYLDKIKKAHPDTGGNPASDYRTAKLLKVAKATVSKYRIQGTCFNDDVAARAAELLGIPAYVVIIDMHYERAKKKNNIHVINAWKDISKKITTTAAALVIATGAASPALEGSSHADFENPDNCYYRNILIRLFLQVKQLFMFRQTIKPFMRPVYIST